jgi:hypothetical protein
MNTALWIAQALLGLAMFASGAMKLMAPRERLVGMMPALGDFTQRRFAPSVWRNWPARSASSCRGRWGSLRF